MRCVATHGENVFIKYLLDMNQRTLARAIAPVLESGKHDGIGNIHLAEQPFQQHITLHTLRYSHIAENGGKRAYPKWILQRNSNVMLMWNIASQVDMAAGLACLPITQLGQMPDQFSAGQVTQASCRQHFFLHDMQANKLWHIAFVEMAMYRALNHLT